MKEQYLAEIQNGYSDGKWWNAKTMQTTEGGRFCKTREEAKSWIDKAVQRGIQTAEKGHTLGTPPFSIYTKGSEKDLVTASRILRREVTEWEEV